MFFFLRACVSQSPISLVFAHLWDTFNMRNDRNDVARREKRNKACDSISLTTKLFLLVE